MRSHNSRHYDIWSLAKTQSQNNIDSSLQQTQAKAADAKSQNLKLDELQTSLLLYGYGAPVETALNGFSTTSDGKKLQLKTRKISSEKIDLIYEKAPDQNNKPRLGSSIRIALDEVGDVGGIISAENKFGFQLSVDPESQRTLGEKLAHVAVARGIKPKASLASGPDITRLELKNKECDFEGPDGRLRKGKIVNLSQVEALIRASSLPANPSIIVFRGPRKYAAEVTSTFEIGFVAKFSTPIPPNEFSANMQFSDA